MSSAEQNMEQIMCFKNTTWQRVSLLARPIIAQFFQEADVSIEEVLHRIHLSLHILQDAQVISQDAAAG